MYNPQDYGRSARRNVLRSNSQQNGIQYGGSQQQWGGSDNSQYQQHQQQPYQQQHSYQPQQQYQQPAAGGAGSYPHNDTGARGQYGDEGAQSYPQYSDSGRGQVGQSDVDDSKSFRDLRTMFGKPTVQRPQQTGVRINSVPGSTSYSGKKPTFRKPAGTTEIEEPGWIPKNKPPPFSQSRYLPASMRSPPINRRQPQHGEGYQSSDSPAWQGTLRSSSVPRAWESQDQPLDQWQSDARPQPSGNPPPGESGEPHSARFYQLINENSDQMEHYKRLPHANASSYQSGGHGSQLSAGGSSYY